MSDETGEGRPRRRNSILAALELFREIQVADNQFRAMTLFLYVCENEGLSVTELAHVARLNIATTARIVRALAGEAPDSAQAAALFSCSSAPGHGRLKMIWLSAQGRLLRDRCEALIGQALPIGDGPPPPTPLQAPRTLPARPRRLITALGQSRRRDAS